MWVLKVAHKGCSLIFLFPLIRGYPCNVRIKKKNGYESCTRKNQPEKSAMEIITVQIGNYASFVGSHFWNLQEKSSPDEVNQSVLLSENSDHIWTPRLLLIDLKDSFGTLGLQNSNIRRSDAYSAAACLWDNKVDKVDIEPLPKNSFIRALDDAFDQFTVGANVPIQKKEKLLEEVEKAIINLSFHCQGLPSEYKRIDELKQQKEELVTDIKRMKKRLIGDLDIDEEIEKNTFLDLDKSEYWSDYLKTYLSPRSLFEFQNFSHKDPNVQFDCFPNGHQLFKNEEDREEIEDKFHWLLEGCDQLQGIQLMLDVDNAFGAIGIISLKYLP